VSELVPHRLFTQQELVLMQVLSEAARNGRDGVLLDGEPEIMVQLVRRLALRVDRLERLATMQEGGK
jgi:hypothetical protein